MIPILKTKRLILRPLQAQDFDDFFEYAQDLRVSEPGMWLPYATRDEGYKSFENILTWYERGLMWWALEERTSGQMIGRCELSNYEPEHFKAELSYALHHDFWGRGYMSEAIEAVMQYGFDVLGIRRVGAKVLVNNDVSRHLLEKFGMQQEGRLRQYHYVDDQPMDVFVYSVLKDAVS